MGENQKFEVGNKVNFVACHYDEIIYEIEKDYGNNVFLIGNEYTFFDMVNGEDLRLLNNGKMTDKVIK